MTFSQIQTRIKNYCNLSSTEADTRIGISINAHYRRITSQLGLEAARFVTRSQTTTNGQQYVIFTEIEKIDRLIDTTDSTAIRLLPEVSLHDIRSAQPGTSQATTWALRNTDADSVTVLLDTVPQTTYTLQADGWTTLSDLSGSDEPIFPESFHDVLVWAVLAEEFLKKEKLDVALKYERMADKLLSDLRFHLADSPTHDTRQGISPSRGAGGGGGSSTLGSTAYTQSALVSFEQDTLRLLDSNESHGLTVNCASNLTAERALDLLTGDADRAITLSGNPTLSDWFDQSVKTTASPTFALPVLSTGVVVGAASTAGIRLDLETGTLAVREGDDSAYGPLKALTLESTGAATVGTSLTVTGGQIAFPATQVASGDVNTLDDYEEGEWTPVLTFVTPGDQSIAYTSQLGRYTKIGRWFEAKFYIVTSTFTHTTASGSLTITGVPFTPDATQEHQGTLSFAGITKANYTQFVPRLNGGTTTIDFIASGSAQARSAVAAADAPTGGTVTLIGSVIGFV